MDEQWLATAPKNETHTLNGNGNPKAAPLSMHCLWAGKCVQILNKNSDKLTQYSDWIQKAGWGLGLNKTENDNKFYRHLISNIEKSDRQNIPDIPRQGLNPFNSKTQEMLDLKKVPGRNPTTLGKTSHRYSTAEVEFLEKSCVFDCETIENKESVLSDYLQNVRDLCDFLCAKCEKDLGLVANVMDREFEAVYLSEEFENCKITQNTDITLQTPKKTTTKSRYNTKKRALQKQKFLLDMKIEITYSKRMTMDKKRLREWNAEEIDMEEEMAPPVAKKHKTNNHKFFSKQNDNDNSKSKKQSNLNKFFVSKK